MSTDRGIAVWGGGRDAPFFFKGDLMKIKIKLHFHNFIYNVTETHFYIFYPSEVNLYNMWRSVQQSRT